MRFVTVLSLAALVFLTAQAPAATRAAIPSLSVEGDEGRVALALDALRVDVLIRGHLARTTFELTYRNDLDSEVDGSFTFPLPVDAEVSEVGLYFDGKLRNAVAVERVQARTAYEETIHRRVDPALAEWSGSTRSFRFRIYPIPARGTKVVHIAYDQELTSKPYELDLRYGVELNAFEVTIDSEGVVESDWMALRRSGNVRTLSGRRTKLDGMIRAMRDSRDTALVSWSAADGMWYASGPVQVRASGRKVEAASHITLLVDTSSSAVQRDAAKLQEFLAGLLARQKPSASVSVLPFHIGVDAPVETGAAGLERTLADLPLAGATNLATLLERLPAIAASAPAGSRIVLVTDGMESLGAPQRVAQAIESLKKLGRSLTVVNASPSADDHLLASLVRATGGWHLDLSQIDPVTAVDAAMHVPMRADVRSADAWIGELLPDTVLVTSGRDLAVSGRSRERILTFDVFAGDRSQLPIRYVDAGRNGDMVIRAWARARLRSMLARGASADEVREHGLRFHQLTPQTSLLVLDTWQDYERYGIPLPPELRRQRDQDMAAAEAARAASFSAGSIAVRGTTSQEPNSSTVWFVKGRVTNVGHMLPGVVITMIETGRSNIVTISNAQGEFWLTSSRVPGPFTVRAELEGFNSVTHSFPRGTRRGTVIEIELPMASISESITVTASSPSVDVSSQAMASNVGSLVNPSSTALADRLLAALVTDAAPVLVEELEPASLTQRLSRIEDVIARLRSLGSTEDRFRYYIAARSVVGGEKFFQAQAALAMREDAPEHAVRALTDLAEAYPNDAPTLRLLGRVLEGWGRSDLARLLFERALDLAPRETQTWRELMLLAAKEGREEDLAQLQRRFDAESRDERMDQTETAISAELQRRRPGADPRLDGTAELQIEAMWDSDYTDIDLHIVEPSGEEVFFHHRKSSKGGQLHDDVRSGFGPETYTLPKLEHGTYQIVLTYYAGDDIRVSMQTLAHVIVYVNGERKDFFSALTARKEREVVATVTW